MRGGDDCWNLTAAASTGGAGISAIVAAHDDFYRETDIVSLLLWGCMCVGGPDDGVSSC